MMRDDFKQSTINLLANRVGWKCSNPGCRRTTRGAGTESTDVINIGVAAHITAAAKGGPRYDNNMTSQERRSYENGIWLCQSCSKLIDSDVQRYSVDKLKKWKEISEQMAVLELETGTEGGYTTDREIIKFLVCCFDRPAFRDPICQEGRMEDFDKAIEDTIIALNTGILRTNGYNSQDTRDMPITMSNGTISEICLTDVEMAEAIDRMYEVYRCLLPDESAMGRVENTYSVHFRCIFNCKWYKKQSVKSRRIPIQHSHTM